MRYEFEIKMLRIVVDAESHEEAEQEAYQKLEYWAGSNTGSENLGNAKLTCVEFNQHL